MFTTTMKALLAASLLLCTSTACIVVTEGEGGGHGWGDDHDAPPRHDGDHWDDFDGEGCFCEEFGEPCDGDDADEHEGHDHEMPGEPVEPGEPGEPVEPDDCIVSMEVCGEDGVTYESPCAASRAHVYVDHEGACGVACIFDSECGAYEQCGDRGICEEFTCPADVEPVCGEDAVTYGNACEARAQHVVIAYTGECLPPCSKDSECDMGSICNMNLCEVANCPVLPADDHSQEVCGDNTFTYATECEARASHIEILHTGCCVQ